MTKNLFASIGLLLLFTACAASTKDLQKDLAEAEKIENTLEKIPLTPAISLKVGDHKKFMLGEDSDGVVNIAIKDSFFQSQYKVFHGKFKKKSKIKVCSWGSKPVGFGEMRQIIPVVHFPKSTVQGKLVSLKWEKGMEGKPAFCLRYTLLMKGKSAEGPMIIYSDNQTVGSDFPGEYSYTAEDGKSKVSPKGEFSVEVD